jgi:hypothetical protein
LLNTLPAQIGAAAILIICAAALWKGDRTEQWGGWICFIGWLISVLIQDDAGMDLEQYAMLGVDLGVFLGLGVLAWKGQRTWPIWAAACQAITVAVNLAKLVDFRIPQYAYISALAIASYGVLIALAVGTVMAWLEREALKPS